ncbi:MAG: methyltransferase domain-containing protein [Gammaproteobacteria bacterium]
MDELQLLVDLHRHAERQGPGGEAETRRAIEMSGLAGREDLQIADIGCGTGASAMVLARVLDARIAAVDFLPVFLETLVDRARQAGLADRITTHAVSMDALPFAPESLDAIWSEGAIYNIGFEAGLRAWRGLLRPGGVLAVSELTWLTDRRPAELDVHWQAEYPAVDTASAKLAILERLGFTPVGYFVLPEHCWLANYYRPMQQRFPEFLAAHGESDEARAVVAAEEEEIRLYERYGEYFGYGFYIARKIREPA